MPEPVVVVSGLRKSYGENEAVRGVDLTIDRGEIFGILGPNGAGKTTTVEILEGYRDRTAGQVQVLGVDPAQATREWRQRVGVVLQECRLPSLLTVRETLTMYAGYYPSPRPVEQTIELVGLGEQADKRNSKLSGGQQRRLDVALALIGDADLLFLDEPTTGFDPAARRGAWDLIANLRALGKTVLLTTHYLEEAQYLADRVAIIKDGRIVAEGKPGELVDPSKAVTHIRFRLPAGVGVGALPGELAGRAVADDGAAGGGIGGRLRIDTLAPVADLAALTGWALAQGVALADLEAVRPSLEDVYLELTAQ